MFPPFSSRHRVKLRASTSHDGALLDDAENSDVAAAGSCWSWAGAGASLEPPPNMPVMPWPIVWPIAEPIPTPAAVDIMLPKNPDPPAACCWGMAAGGAC